MIATILDLETTGLCPVKDKVVEFALINWDPATDELLDVATSRVKAEGYSGDYDASVEALTGIKRADLMVGMSVDDFTQTIGRMTAKSDWVIAHNAPFDLQFLPKLSCQVMDTVKVIPPSPARKSNSLEAICQFHRIDGICAHRAMFDVIALWQVLRLYDWEMLVKRASAPVVRQVAVMAYEEFKMTPAEKKPQAFGFRWDPKSKVWFREMLQCDLEDQLPFTTRLATFSEAS